MVTEKRKAQRKANAHCTKLVESYCPDCGRLIAASPFPRLLMIVEALHEGRCVLKLYPVL